MIVEILFLASQFQCGSDAAQAQFEIYANNEVPIAIGEKTYVSVDSIEDLQFGYTVISDGDCALSSVAPIGISYGETLPANQGVYQQPSLTSLISDHVTQPYLSLVLYELGTTYVDSSAYDLQDIVILVNTQPTIFAD